MPKTTDVFDDRSYEFAYMSEDTILADEEKPATDAARGVRSETEHNA